MARLLGALTVAAGWVFALADAATLGEGSALNSAGRHRLAHLEKAWGRVLAGQGSHKKESPVKRVVAVLQKMRSELDDEARQESALYDKTVCWCQTNEKEKTRAIAEADAKDAQLVAEIEGRGARFGQLTAEATQLKEQIASDKAALKEAVAIKEAGAAEAYQDQKEMVQAINNLENAVAVLSKHQSSFLQTNKPLIAGLRVLLRDAAERHESLTAGRAPRRRRGAAFLALGTQSSSGMSAQEQGVARALLGALDVSSGAVPAALPLKFAERMVERSAKSVPSSGAAFLQASSAAPVGSYNSRSGEVVGILGAMLDDFRSELSKSKAAAQKAAEGSAAVIVAKEAEIDAGKKRLDQFEAEHAGNQKALADAKEDLEATRKQRVADVEFLQNLKLQCNDLDSQWEQRSKTRGAEITAVAETIAMLTEDESHDLISRATMFLQLQSARSGEAASAAMGLRRSRAVAALRKAAEDPSFDADDLLAAWRGRLGPSPSSGRSLGAAAGPRARLSTLAMAVKLDSFDKVKEAIDTMVSELNSQQAEEVKFKGYCQEQLSENDKALYIKNEQKKDAEAKIEQLAALVDNLEKDIASAERQIADTQTAIKRAGENREKENADFQSTVADQRATQELLRKALARLQEFYVKGLGKAFVQRGGQTPPVQFNAYKESQGASPVMGLLEQIIGDSAKLEKEALAGEMQAQKTYETFVKDSNAVVAELKEAVTTKTKGASAGKLEKAQAGSDLESAARELGSLSAYEGDLHSQCDWVLKNFDIRQTARLQEIEAIQAAKAILSGAK